MALLSDLGLVPLGSSRLQQERKYYASMLSALRWKGRSQNSRVSETLFGRSLGRDSGLI